MINDNKTNELTADELTPDEKAQLKLWASATPMQRLAWLEEAQQIAANSGALQSKPVNR